MKRQKLLNRLTPMVFIALLVSVSLMSVPPQVLADDTEVFFPPATTTGSSSINPNILFVIDTSGSMATDDYGDGQSRLKRVQVAFRQIMQEFGNNVNIGLARFSNTQGGPILFPVSPIDSKPFGTTLKLDITEGGTCANEADQNRDSSANDSTCSGKDTHFSLRLGTDYDKIYEQGDNQDEAEEWSTGTNNTLLWSSDANNRFTDAASSAAGSRCSRDLDLSYDTGNLLASILGTSTCQGILLSLAGARPKDQKVGIRFPNVDIPKSGTTVRYASLTVTDTGANSANTPVLQVVGERTANATNYKGGLNNSGVTRTNSSGNPPPDRTLTSPTTSTCLLPICAPSFIWTPAAGTANAPFFTATAGTTSSGQPDYSVGTNLKDIVQSIIQAKSNDNAAPVNLIITKGANVLPNDVNNVRTVYGTYNGTANGTAINQRPKLAVVYSGGSYTKLMTGVRFQNVRIPRGAQVTRAWIEFHNAETVDDRSLNIDIYGDKSADSQAFSPPVRINNRTLTSGVSQFIPPTSGVVHWNTTKGGDESKGLGAWVVPYKSYITPNLNDIVNEITSAPGSTWCGGNSMTFFFKYVSGDAGRNAVSANINPSYAPILHIELDTSQDAYVNGCVNGSSVQQISASTNDAEEASKTVATAGTSFTMGNTSSTYDGFRFDKLNIPQGATITSAYLDLTASSNDTAATSLTIAGEKVTNSAAFASSNKNISNRYNNNPTSATVTWSGAALPSWTLGATYTTPDLKTILQELVNQSGWTTASAVTLLINGSGKRRAYTFDGSGGNAPKLRVTYQGSNGGNTAETVRNYLPDLVDSFSATGYTPTVGALYEVARYFRGEAAYYGRTRGGGYSNTDKSGEPDSSANLMNVSSDAAMVPGTGTHNYPTVSGVTCSTSDYKNEACSGENWSGTPIYQSPIQDGCQGSNIVLLSDGYPNNTATSDGTTTAKANVQTMIGKNCLTYKNSSNQTQSDWTCGPDLTGFLNTTDQIPAGAATGHLGLSGNQFVRTYTIGFGADVASGGTDSNGAEFLNLLSQKGGGQYYSASDSTQLVNAFRSIVSNILNINTTFVAPAVTVNAFHQLTDRNELYFAVFKPGTNVDWRGNLKRYQLDQKPTDSNVEIYDYSSPTQLAVDSATGFFKDGTKSYWSASPDGSDVAQGGVASVLTNTRNVYTYVSSTPPSNIALSSSSIYRVQSSNLTLNPSDTTTNPASLTANEIAANARLGMPAGSLNADRAKAISWAAGIDVYDDNGNGVYTDARTQLGDPLHSQPQLITYGGTDTAPDIAVFMGTNDGGLHAFNTADGSEYFTFVPQELLSNFYSYSTDTGSYQTRHYGMDGPLTLWINDLNGDGKLFTGTSLQTGEFAYIYAGMRRGGNNYYALDVTQRTAPVLKFQITGGVAGTSYKELGQTWSAPIHARIRVDATSSGAKDVLIFTGGYDPNVDGQLGSPVAADSHGRALFVADATTGALLWWAGFDDTSSGNTIHPNLAVPQMIYSIPASPNVIDLDNDGYVDRIYVADAGGQIFRFILGKNASNGVRSLADATVQYIAKLSGSTASSAHRFYSSPDVSRITTGTPKPYLSIAIGSGFREHPLDTSIEERFFVLRDPDVSNDAYTVPNIASASTTAYIDVNRTGPDDLYDATSNFVGATCGTTNSQADIDCRNNKATAVAALGDATTTGTAKGFYLRLVDGTTGALKGEKVLADSITFNGQIVFATFEPGSTATNTCTAARGLSRLYQINVNNGAPVADYTPSNGTNQLGKDDRYQTLRQGGLPPAPTILFPAFSSYTTTDSNGNTTRVVNKGGDTLPDDAILYIGPERPDLKGFDISTKKTSWQKVEN